MTLISSIPVQRGLIGVMPQILRGKAKSLAGLGLRGQGL
jgi:hypothetical protein